MPSPRDVPSKDADGLATSGPNPAWHSLSIERVTETLGADPERGLTRAEAEARLERDGPNRLRAPEGRSAWSILVAQFRSIITLLLLGAVALALVLGDTFEAYAVLVVIAINVLIGFFTELRAERAMAALAEQAAPAAQVIRDGREQRIPAEQLVVGDLVVLNTGDRVPADGRLTEAARLQVQEASLTGESVPVDKDVDARVEESAPLAERPTMLYLGTNVTDGRGEMIVTGTGMDTEVGKVGALLEEASRQPTPLEERLEQLGRSLIVIVAVLCALIVVAGLLRGNELLYMLEMGISLAIAAVPEGLPAVATMTLAIGVQRMARANALVRRLPAVETLGSTTVVCTDKTGTLTANEMTVRRVVVDGKTYTVTGTGYEVEGAFELGGREVDPADDAVLRRALRIGALCNDAELGEEGGRAVVLGDPTEGALTVAAAKAGLERHELEAEAPRVAEVPFDSDAQRMITVHDEPGKGRVAYVKGAPAAILNRCTRRLTSSGVEPLSEADKQASLEANRAMADDALRVLAVAYRELPDGAGASEAEHELVFVGLFGMLDPLRDEVVAAIERCQAAGVRVVMITGDQTRTAEAIAGQLGIDKAPDGTRLRTVHASELVGLDDAGWREVARTTAVFARVSPEHKLRIVEALQRDGQVVAMTGDGVNDAPAVRSADIGIAMGLRGTAVAKEAADMILRDDDFGTIVKAIEQGRVIYANITRFIHYLFSCNIAEILTVSAAIVIGWPLPLAPLQILWLNIVTDVFPAMALALEPSRRGVMDRPPRDPNERLLNRRFATLIGWQGTLLAAVALTAFGIGLARYGSGDGLHHAVTLSFMTLALAQVFHAFNVRSTTESVFTRDVFRNLWLWAAVVVCLLLQLAAVYVPVLQRALRTVPPSPRDWALIVGLSLLPVVVVELVKLARRRSERS